MVFNGHTEQYVETIDEELFTEIQVMYADGLLGNKSIFDAVAPLTAAVFNYFRADNATAIKTSEVFPWVHEYSVDPSNDVDPDVAVSNSLFGWISQAKGFSMERFANGKPN
ncbi:hypothetical protein UFOVP79_26 [uncultured Caudovirales phage]|uniref:Uncharacterized protein n=1 Tax=uncultured Caudovirales phage TaxID=2100421 RepID=A0A6J5L4B8_9CAUD|nr:hypothetical protein UFOVP79_26 [uncultured Caudovirales phage]